MRGCAGKLLPSLALALLLQGAPPGALALEEYAQETGQPCLACHVSDSGGSLNSSGESYGDDPSAWVPPARRPAPAETPSTALRLVRLLVLFAHIAFAVIWMGTILYVHIVLKPAYAMGGLPRNEVRLARLSIPVLLATGSFLTWFLRARDPGLFQSRFGTILLAKVAVFLVMLATAIFATRVLSPRLRALAKGKQPLEARTPVGESLSPSRLRAFDGKEGRPAWVSVDGVIRDVSGSRLWKEGTHARRHQAGEDLTAALAGAPHGPEVVLRMPEVGVLSCPAIPAPWPVRVFLFLAYFNLGAVLLILFLLALWRY